MGYDCRRVSLLSVTNTDLRPSWTDTPPNLPSLGESVPMTTPDSCFPEENMTCTSAVVTHPRHGSMFYARRDAVLLFTVVKSDCTSYYILPGTSAQACHCPRTSCHPQGVSEHSSVAHSTFISHHSVLTPDTPEIPGVSLNTHLYLLIIPKHPGHG